MKYRHINTRESVDSDAGPDKYVRLLDEKLLNLEGKKVLAELFYMAETGNYFYVVPGVVSNYRYKSEMISSDTFAKPVTISEIEPIKEEGLKKKVQDEIKKIETASKQKLFRDLEKIRVDFLRFFN